MEQDNKTGIEQFSFLEKSLSLPSFHKAGNAGEILSQIFINKAEKEIWKKYRQGYENIDPNNLFKVTAFFKEFKETIERDYEERKQKGENPRITLLYLALKQYGEGIGRLASRSMGNMDALSRSDTFIISAKQFVKAEELLGYSGPLTFDLYQSVGFAGDFRVEAGLEEEGEYLQQFSCRLYATVFGIKIESPNQDNQKENF